MIKKLLSSLLILAVIVLSVPLLSIPVSAGTYGVFTYTISGGAVAIDDCDTTVSGHLTIPSTIEGLPVTSIGYYAFGYCINMSGVTIPASVTSIGAYAFIDCFALTSVTIPSGVTKVEYATFLNCASLTSVTIPASVTSIGNHAFNGCNTLAGITIPDGVTSIGEGAFNDCSKLTGITIPDGVTSIGTTAFFGCSLLASVTIPDSVTSIGQQAFYGCSKLTGITIPNSVTSIGHYAFSRCLALVSATIPANTAILGTGVFDYTALSSLTFRNMKQNASMNFVEDQGSYSAADTIDFSKIKTDAAVNVTIYNPYAAITGAITHAPASSVTVYGHYRNAKPFANLKGHAFVPMIYTLTAADLTYTIKNGTVEITDCADTVYFQAAIPAEIGGYSVTAIGDDAFYNCSRLTYVIIPDGVTSIGYNAFESCSALECVQIPDSVTRIAPHAFYRCFSLKDMTIPSGVTRIEDGLFSYCASLTGIQIPDSVTSIAPLAFYRCSSLKSVTVPVGVTSVGNSAFYGCSGLVSAILPANTAILGSNVFTGTALSNITFRNMKRDASGNFVEDKESYSAADTIDFTIIEADDITNAAIYNPYAAINGVITREPASEVTVRGYHMNAKVFAENNGYIFEEMMYTLTAADMTYTINDGTVVITDCVFDAIAGPVVIPANIDGYSVTGIGDSAFFRCYSLEDITIPDSVTSIGDSAFFRCYSLEDITIPDSVTSIGNSAFWNCYSLESVTIPDGLTNLGDAAFYNCFSLTGVTIPDGVTNLGDSVFCNCFALTGITIPDGVTNIDNYAFYGCSALLNVNVPDSVTNIGNFAFDNCAQLQNMFIPDSVTSFGDPAIDGVAEDFVLYCYDGSAAKTYAVNNGLSYVLVAPFALKVGSSLVINASTLIFAEKGMTVTALLNEFTNTNFTVHKNGTEITGGAFVGTGCELKLIAGPLTAKTLTAVVMGDLSGDGAVDALDAFLCDKAANSHSTLTGAYYAAANLDTADPDIDIKDVSRLMDRAVGIRNEELGMRN